MTSSDIFECGSRQLIISGGVPFSSKMTGYKDSTDVIQETVGFLSLDGEKICDAATEEPSKSTKPMPRWVPSSEASMDPVTGCYRTPVRLGFRLPLGFSFVFGPPRRIGIQNPVCYLSSRSGGIRRE